MEMEVSTGKKQENHGEIWRFEWKSSVNGGFMRF